MGRSFQGPYRDTRVRRPDFPLAEAIGWYLADRGEEIAPTTIATYRSHLAGFVTWLPQGKRVLASVEPEAVERYVRETAKNQNTPMNKTVALKSTGVQELLDAIEEHREYVKKSGLLEEKRRVRSA